MKRGFMEVTGFVCVLEMFYSFYNFGFVCVLEMFYSFYNALSYCH